MKSLMNDTIVSLIRAARGERGVTQKELADYLGKTQATMSDLERGKVQVSASELYEISQYLNKPIEYFYGVETGNKEIQEIVATIRKQPLKDRLGGLKMARRLVELQMLAARLEKNPDKINQESAKEFYDLFIPFSEEINEQYKQVNEMRKKIEEYLNVKEFESSKKTKKRSK